jgi:hypothetical protein
VFETLILLLASWSTACSPLIICKDKKGKAVPVTDHGGPWGCEISGLPHFLDNRLTDGREVVSLTRRQAAFYPPQNSWCSIVSETGWTPGP